MCPLLLRLRTAAATERLWESWAWHWDVNRTILVQKSPSLEILLLDRALNQAREHVMDFAPLAPPPELDAAWQVVVRVDQERRVKDQTRKLEEDIRRQEELIRAAEQREAAVRARHAAAAELAACETSAPAAMLAPCVNAGTSSGSAELVRAGDASTASSSVSSPKSSE